MKLPLRFFKNLKFRNKLFLSYIVVVIIPILVLGSYSYNTSRSFLIQQEYKRLSESVEKISFNLDYKFNKFNSAMEFVTMNPRFIEIFNRNYTDMFMLYKDISDVVVPMINTIQGLDTDIKKIAVCTTNDFPELSGSITNMEGMKDEFWMELPIEITETNWYISSGRLVGLRGLMKQYKSKINSLFYLELDYENIFRDINMDKFQQYEALLIDKNNHIVFSQNRLTESKMKFTDKDIAKSDSDEIVVNGEKYLLLKAEIPAAKWWLYYYIPINSLAIDAEKIIMATFLVTSICLLVLVLVIWLFSGAFFKRIDNLNRKMRIVENGNLKVDIHSDSTDEIGNLINGVGNMLNSINQLMEEVYHRKIKQKEAEIKLLQSQINPHFLYNSLSLVNWRAIKIKATEISYIITTLSKYYRTTLNKGKNFISVKDEIDNIISYINIQLLMHNDGFDVEYDVDKSVYEYYMPNLTLQPIVENAIEHGVGNKEEGRGNLSISAKLDEGLVKIIIEDNGPGMSQEILQQALTHQSKGYGIKNVDDRIKLIFGEEFGLFLKSEVGSGTVVKVIIPIHKKERNQDEVSYRTTDEFN